MEKKEEMNKVEEKKEEMKKEEMKKVEEKKEEKKKEDRRMRWRLADTSARHLEAHSAGLYWTLRPSSSSQSLSSSSQSISSGLSSTWASSQSASFVFTTLVLVKMINKNQL